MWNSTDWKKYGFLELYKCFSSIILCWRRLRYYLKFLIGLPPLQNSGCIYIYLSIVLLISIYSPHYVKYLNAATNTPPQIWLQEALWPNSKLYLDNSFSWLSGRSWAEQLSTSNFSPLLSRCAAHTAALLLGASRQSFHFYLQLNTCHFYLCESFGTILISNIISKFAFKVFLQN